MGAARPERRVRGDQKVSGVCARQEKEPARHKDAEAPVARAAKGGRKPPVRRRRGRPVRGAYAAHADLPLCRRHAHARARQGAGQPHPARLCGMGRRGRGVRHAGRPEGDGRQVRLEIEQRGRPEGPVHALRGPGAAPLVRRVLYARLAGRKDMRRRDRRRVHQGAAREVPRRRERQRHTRSRMRVGNVPVPRRKAARRVRAAGRAAPQRRPDRGIRMPDGPRHGHTPGRRRDVDRQHVPHTRRRRPGKAARVAGRLAAAREVGLVRARRGGGRQPCPVLAQRHRARATARVPVRLGRHRQVRRRGGGAKAHAARDRRAARRGRKGCAARRVRLDAKDSRGGGRRRLGVVHTQPGRAHAAKRRPPNGADRVQPAVGHAQQDVGQGARRAGRRARPRAWHLCRRKKGDGL